MDNATKMILKNLNLTSAVMDSDRSFIAKEEIVFAMSGREVVMLANGYEEGRMAISGDVIGNGLNRTACEKALFKAYKAA